jgi:putative transcriptional regulator
MTSENRNRFHTVGDEWLAAYSAGALTDSKRLVVDCQMALHPTLAEEIERFDQIGGAFIETSNGETMSEGFVAKLDELISKLETQNHLVTEDKPSSGSPENWMPHPLNEFLKETDVPLKWQASGPGVERAVLCEENGERLYLLKARPGLKMPVHSHRGQEWTLVLQGGYHVGENAYKAGDLHCEDETCQHQPVIDDDGEDCISLVVDEGKLVFKDPIARIAQLFIGI